MFDPQGRIFVAGHTGLLGSALLRVLEEEGCRPPITRTHGELDLKDRAAVEALFVAEGPEYVFLAAGLAGGIQDNRERPATYLHENLAIQDSVFEACLRHQVRQVVFCGSSCTYPKVCTQPMCEADWLSGPVEETSRAYAAAKIAGMTACWAYNQQYGANRFICLVPGTMYGPNDHFDPKSAHVISAMMRRFAEARRSGAPEVVLWGTGTPKREFVHASDVARAAVFAMKNAERLENAFYNVGTGEETEIRILARLIAGVAGYTGALRFDTSKPNGAFRKLLDSTRFRTLGWSPRVRLEDGLKSAYAWFLEHIFTKEIPAT
ncbi:MAG: GDP-L-fucose synthase [Planctomycetes bacterium]|nr:GDP-L-fucose synthase [Planctomycetota bacterium]